MFEDQGPGSSTGGSRQGRAAVLVYLILTKKVQIYPMAKSENFVPYFMLVAPGHSVLVIEFL